jgi:hypothetical protein
MIRDVIERFSYRFDLWARERDEEHLGAGGSRSASRIYRKDESVFQMVVRYVGVTALSIVFFTIIGRIVIRFAPGASFAVFVTLVIFIPIWILCGITVFVAELKAKRALAAEDHKSSNKSLEPTAGRCTKKVEG